MSLCWSSQGFSALHYRLCFLQCDWRRQISLQKVTNVNEVQEIGWMSPDSSLVPKLFLIEERGNEPGDEANQTLSCRWVWPQDYNPLAYCQHLTRYGSLIPFCGFFQRLEFKRTWKAQWYRLQSSDLSLLGLLQALCICYTTIINSPKLLTIVFTADLLHSLWQFGTVTWKLQVTMQYVCIIKANVSDTASMAGTGLVITIFRYNHACTRLRTECLHHTPFISTCCKTHMHMQLLMWKYSTNEPYASSFKNRPRCYTGTHCPGRVLDVV